MFNQLQSQQQVSQLEVQAQSNASQEVLAVACVIDASLALATEWSRVLTAYILPILKRLNEAYHGHNFRLALVTYGAADTYPSPLLSQRFFLSPNFVMKELREDPRKLGIGSVIGARGLSALEGMVAAIELFDILHNSLALTGPKDGRMHVSHIIHIAGSPPDSAQRPLCNNLSHLDSVSWDTLPVELKKRKINLSLVTLQQIQQFQDVQSATSAPAPQTNPWFTVYPPHVLMLSGFPLLSHVQTPKLNVAKRSNESPQTPDTKRQKVNEKSSPALSPRPPGGGAGPLGQRPPSRQVLTPSVPPSTLPQPRSQLLQPSPIPPHATTTSAPSPAKLPAKPVAHLPSNAPNPNAPPTQHTFPPNVNMVVERGKALEVEIKVIEAKLQEAQSAGNAADVESLQMERVAKYQQAMKIKTILYTIANRPAMGGSNSGAGGSGETPQPQPQPQPAASNIKSEHVAPLTVSAPMEEQKPPLTDQQALIHLMQARSGTTPYANPELAAQMHKLLNKTGIPGPTFSGSPQPRPAHPPASGSTSQHQSQPQPQPQPQASTSAISGGPNQWEGSFTIQHAGQPKGFEVQVAAVMSSKGQPHTETWPERMFIDIPQGGLKDPSDLKSWLQKHHQSAVIAQFRPQARSIEQKKNDAAHNALMRIMMEARTFGIVAWQLPSGTMSQNMIVFPMSNKLVGAVFPVTGLPDLPGSGKVDGPKPQPQQLQQPQLPLQQLQQPQSQPPGVFTPEMLTRLQGLDPQQQRRFMQQLALQQKIRQRQRELQQHQQLQAGAMQQEVQAPAPGVGMQNMSPFSNGSNMPMNMFGGGGVPQRQINGGMQLGGVGSTVNSEMMQSFMQRSANGQGMNPRD
ncbi:uncharacterized protein HD556DRAFT_486865 [Suillus plorans]|uniref:Mediator of RNA polymerase II transcription subunit 25 von Willebrand factor type A domain-containing protein n=1 Tax=Suillus plorans TaxID=116603 RepID=A0A9P7J612_9AGAM|nr:uncharacterized protein HD556DRAFT_486865 [Suillus plorans]KAG1804880.1 hypothetical protein HD556DRAFT_486865 [Suillus plorans]